jgi:hypothetical protein
MDIASIIAILGVLSLSVERVVEMIKNLLPFLSKKYDDERKARYRRFGLHFLAGIIGFLIALAAQEQIDYVLFKNEDSINCWGCVILGLLASGGSGFWNQSLGIVEEIKKAKKFQFKQNKTNG